MVLKSEGLLGELKKALAKIGTLYCGMTGDGGLLELLYSGSQLHASRFSLPIVPNLIRPTFLASQTIV
ncbi:MAG: hypothetical protein IIA09_11995 [Proteobacteria bacterium]|nr:hypothetical protein [Pseudomonadota bacterium]